VGTQLQLLLRGRSFVQQPKDCGMTRLTTVFRLVVMMVAAIIAVEGWQHYGPSTAQLKSLAARVLDVAQQSLTSAEPAGTVTSGIVAKLPDDGPSLLTTPAPATAVAPPLAETTGFPAAPAVFAPAAPLDAIGTTSADTASASPGADPLPALMSRLKELGGTDPQLVAWGRSGQLYRFCCQAALTEAPHVKRHFESVAEEPSVALQEVVGQVEAWRAAERNRGQLR
jgi:hypothetical protein